MRFILTSLLLFVAQVTWAEEPVDLVRVLKAERKLQLISNGKVQHEFTIALGGNPVGHKKQEGDERTPEGRYTLIKNVWRKSIEVGGSEFIVIAVQTQH